MNRPTRRFMFKLALALGKTVAEISDMSARELAEWQQFWKLEPFGDSVYLSALARRQIGVALGGERDMKPYMPAAWVSPESEELEPDQALAAFASALGVPIE